MALTTETKRNRRTWVIFLLWMTYLLATLPVWWPPYIPYGTLDGGYRAALNYGHIEEVHFGTEMVATTGPLGFLRNPGHFHGTDSLRLAWDLFLTLLLGTACWALLKDESVSRTVLRLLLLALLLFFLNHELWRTLPLFGFLYLLLKLREEDSGNGWWELPMCAALAINSLILFTEMIASCVAITGVFFVHLFRHRRLSWCPAWFVAFLGLAWFLSGQTFANVLPYLRSAIEVAAGYSDVMVRYCSVTEPIQVWALFLLTAAAPATYLAQRFGAMVTLASATAIGGQFFILYKANFTRCHPIRTVVIGAVVCMLALFATRIARRMPGRRWLGLSWTALALSVAFSISLLWQFGGTPPDPIKRVAVLASHPRDNVRALLKRLTTPEKLEEGHDHRLGRIRRRFPLPAIEGSTDWFGDLQGILVANELEYRPRPVFQRFTAYTEKLAEQNAAFYRSESAPETVVMDFQRLSNYPLALFDGPAFIELYHSYLLHDETDDFVILRRAESRRPYRKTLLSTESLPIGEFVDLPTGRALLWVEVDVGHTWFARLTKLAHKLPGIWLDVLFENGTRQRFRFAAQPAATGFLLSPLVETKSDFVDLAHSPTMPGPDRRVKSFRVFQLPSSSRYRQSATYRIYEILSE